MYAQEGIEFTVSKDKILRKVDSLQFIREPTNLLTARGHLCQVCMIMNKFLTFIMIMLIFDVQVPGLENFI